MTLNAFEQRTVPRDLRDLACRARAALTRFTSYPRTSLRLEFGGGGSAFVVASIETEDAERPERAVRVQKAARFDLRELHRGVDARLGALARDALIRLFTHEVDEWLRLDGSRCRRPHPDPIRRLALHLPEQAAPEDPAGSNERPAASDEAARDAARWQRLDEIADEWWKADGSPQQP